MYIIIPTVDTHAIVYQLLQSIEENSVYKHNVLLMTNEGSKYPPNSQSFYLKTQDAIDANDGLFLVTNNDMIFGYEWDKALLKCHDQNDCDITSMSNICDLTFCGWGFDSLHARLETHGAEQPSWVSRTQTDELYKKFQEYSVTKRNELHGKSIPGYNFIPFLISKDTFYKVLNGQSYTQVGDVGFFNRCKELNLNMRIACDSLCYHYVSLFCKPL